MITAPITDKIKSTWNVIRNLKNVFKAQRLFLKFDDRNTFIAKDRSGWDHDATYVGPKAADEIWNVPDKSALIDGDYFTVPAAPFNNFYDFTFSGWVKTTTPNFTMLSCKRDNQVALEITNKKVIIQGDEVAYDTPA